MTIRTEHTHTAGMRRKNEVEWRTIHTEKQFKNANIQRENTNSNNKQMVRLKSQLLPVLFHTDITDRTQTISAQTFMTTSKTALKQNIQKAIVCATDRWDYNFFSLLVFCSASFLSSSFFSFSQVVCVYAFVWVLRVHVSTSSNAVHFNVFVHGIVRITRHGSFHSQHIV